MRKEIIAILAAAVLIGCTKDQQPQGETTITFAVGGVTSGQMTKSVTDLLAATLPSGKLALRLKSTTNAMREYTVTAGEAVTIPLDTYQVTGAYTPAASFNCPRGAFYLEPKYSVSSRVEVDGETDTITLPVTWDCFAIIRDNTKVASVLASNASATPQEVTAWAGDGDLRLVYASCISAWDSSMALQLIVTPADAANYQATSWWLSTTDTAGMLQVRNGYWYEFDPEGVETGTGSLDFDFPAWINGTNQ